MRRAALICSFYFAITTTIASPAQVLTTLVNFAGPNGAGPLAPLIQGTDGNLYGTTLQGGASEGLGFGTVFKVTTDGVLTTLYSFQNISDGSNPYAPVTQASDGNFYGTTSSGGANFGTVFSMTPMGVLTTLHSFNVSDGLAPYAGLVQGADGLLYGTTTAGGSFSDGTIFRIALNGDFSNIHAFASSDGAGPYAPLVQASDGNFYGTTQSGGANASGTIFRITPQGAFTVLHNFTQIEDAGGPSGLIQATDGNLYGTTVFGGGNFCGIVFRVTLQGALTVIHSLNCTEAAVPHGVIQATDGNLYGTSSAGGTSQNCFRGCGTIFKTTLEGDFSTVYSFSGPVGASPAVGLLQANDGSFYGTTYNGGTYGYGTLFRIVIYSPLSMTKSGNGTVASGDGHINCGSACSYTYNAGVQVRLTAIPAPGYTFSSWTGCDNVNGTLCLVTMDSAKNVTATFTTSSVGLSALTLNPSSVKGGNISIATITLNAPAPSGGLSVGVATNSPLAVHPPSVVTIPPGVTSYSFPVRTSVVRTKTVANVIASAGASQVNATLTVTTGYGSSQAAMSEPQR